MKFLNLPILSLCLLGILFFAPSCKDDDPELTIQDRLENETPLEIVNSGISVEELYGKIYLGGLIFYLNTTDGTGLVARSSDQGDVIWGCLNTDVQDLNNISDNPPDRADQETEAGTRIGDGNANTNAMINTCMETEDHAALVCRNEGPDWFLPSRAELELMYRNLQLNGFGNFAQDYYWSSTEMDSSKVWVQLLADQGGTQTSWGKDIKIKARAVRSF